MAHSEDGDHNYRLSTGFEVLSIETQFSDIEDEDDSYKTDLVVTTPPRLSIDVQQLSADSPISMVSFDLDNLIVSHRISRDGENNLADKAAEEKQPEVVVDVVDLNSCVDLNVGIGINDGVDLDGASDILRKVLTRAPITSPILPPNTSPLSNTEPASAEGSIASFGSNDDEWDKAQLLAMSDEVRATLQSSTFPPQDLERLDELLSEFLSDERSPYRAMEFSVIVHARLDKLLELLYIKWNATHLDIPFQLAAAKANSLQHKWQQRFKAKYFLIPETRTNEMKTNGALKRVALDPGERRTGQRWLVLPHPIANCERDQNFQPGDWWLNLSCAFRDGIVGNVEEIVSQGQYGITALPMLTGTEVEGQTLGTSTYIREGTMDVMHLSLMPQVGRTVRALRGHALKSMYAPEAGIRYDGMYHVRQYSHKLDQRSENYRLELTLERVKGQTSMNELRQIPKPSQQDDWEIYCNIIGEDIRVREGVFAWREWVFEDQKQWNESEGWKRQMDFRLEKYASG